MTKISDALTYGLTIRESQNDGSDFTSPIADYRRLFLGEDGSLHLKDAAGTVTAIGGGGDITTDAAWAAKGDLIVGTANNTAAVLTAGNNGKVLMAASGEATGLKWDTPAAGALVLLEQHTASSSATLDFTTCISSTYSHYIIELEGIVPATNAVGFYMRMSTDGGANYDAGANYAWARFAFIAVSSGTEGSETATGIILGPPQISTTTYWALDGTYHFKNPGGTTYKRVYGESFGADSRSVVANGELSAGHWRSATAVDAFRFIMSSGNIASGTILVYGIAKA